MSWNTGRDPKKHPMGGDVLMDSETEVLVYFVEGDRVHLCKRNMNTGRQEEGHVTITQWRDETRRSSVKVICKFL